MYDVIEIPHIEVMARIGLTAAERATPQPLIIGIRLELTVSRRQGDELSGTFDYSVLDRVVPASLLPAPKLLETLAERIMLGIIDEADCSRVHTIEIAVTKCQPPLALATDGVTVRLSTQLSHGFTSG
jgi:dihydroneopterin aldolase